MIYFSSDFVKTGYTGYLFNIKDKKLYTLKTTGVLRPMTFNKGGTFNNHIVPPGYQISDKGVRKNLTMNYLLSLKRSFTLQNYTS